MLVAQEQLQFVKGLVALFERPARPPGMVAPTLAVQSQYIAIVVMLRAIGHTFEIVDCDTRDKKRWAKEAWKAWQKETIFAEFIKPTRDALVKEFRGGLTLRTLVVAADPGMPGGITVFWRVPC
jgi:hypothetical protein